MHLGSSSACCYAGLKEYGSRHLLGVEKHHSWCTDAEGCCKWSGVQKWEQHLCGRVRILLFLEGRMPAVKRLELKKFPGERMQ